MEQGKSVDKEFSPRIQEEWQTVQVMIQLYCRKKEGNTRLCDDCRELTDYAYKRLSHCRFSQNKPTCRKCPIHCYRPDMRERMQTVMRYSGPRMILYHPCMAVRHIFRERKKG